MSSPEDAKRKLEASDEQPNPISKALKVSPDADAGSTTHVENAAVPLKPPRKKPGRKPNPASPTLRKEQNRAAQRAFRERKERHVRELETTIKRLTDERYIADLSWRSTIDAVTYEMNAYKQLASVFQNELNSILGREAVDKIKEEVLGGTYTTTATPVVTPNIYGSGNGQSSLGAITIVPIDPATSDVQLQQQQQKSFLPSPNGSPQASSAMLSPMTSAPSTPTTLIDLQNPLENEIDNLKSSPPAQPESEAELFFFTSSELANELAFDSFAPTITTAPTPEPPLIDQDMRAALQLIDLAKFVKAPQFRMRPLTRHALTPQQLHFLRQPHDARIDLVPSLQLRSRMIEHSDKYDLYELIEMLIKKAKCHGDPHDPASWEMPEEFFEKYKFLTFNYCKIKSNLYRRYGGDAMIITNMLKSGVQPEIISDTLALG